MENGGPGLEVPLGCLLTCRVIQLPSPNELVLSGVSVDIRQVSWRHFKALLRPFARSLDETTSFRR